MKEIYLLNLKLPERQKSVGTLSRDGMLADATVIGSFYLTDTNTGRCHFGTLPLVT